MGGAVGSRTPRGTPATRYPDRLRTTPHRFVSVLHHRDMSTNKVKWLGTEAVCACVSSHLFMDQWTSFGDRERSDRALLAELWRVFPPKPNEPALPAVHLRGLSCQSRSSSEIHSHVVIGVVILL